jgi:hypothetical protein
VKNVFIENDGLESLMELIKGILDSSSIDFINMTDFEAEIKAQMEYGLDNQPDIEVNTELLQTYAQIKENFITDMQELIKEMGLIALECLFVMSFNKKASEILKKNQEFMSDIEKLANDNRITDERVKKAVDGLLWKLEKEDEFIQQQETTTIKQNDEFDLMISYSWNDKLLIHQIYKYLTEQFNYTIWLDENQMSGSLCQAMAQAVEKSKFVLICMSETYKASENCRNEAEYARDRKKIIIPLIIKTVERDGWLGFISAGKIYIDFAKQDFQKAIQLLNDEIQRNQRQKEENLQPVKLKE